MYICARIIMQAYYYGNLRKNFINRNAYVFRFSVTRKTLWLYKI